MSQIAYYYDLRRIHIGTLEENDNNSILGLGSYRS